MRGEKGYVAHHAGHDIYNDNIIYCLCLGVAIPSGLSGLRFGLGQELTNELIGIFFKAIFSL